MDESAFSETIGVILIVALTVILAALVGANAFGLVGERIPSNHNIILTWDKPNISTITVSYLGGHDQTLLKSMRIIWPNGTTESIDVPKVGKTYGPSDIIAESSRNHLVIVGNFSPDREQVLMDTYL